MKLQLLNMFRILHKKTDNLWVKQKNTVYLKDKAWWQYTCLTDYYWYWKKIQTIREMFAPGFTQNGWQNANGHYTIKGGYFWRIGDKEAQPQGRSVWNRMNLPKHSFICWFTMHQRQQTKARLCHLGINQDDSCPMCGTQVETIQHLFFEYSFSKQ